MPEESPRVRNVTLPDGTVVNMAVISNVTVSTNVVTFTWSGTAITYTAASAAEAQFVLAQINNGANVIEKRVFPQTITHVATSKFDYQIDQIIVKGHGFKSTAAGLIWIEDEVGGQDQNGPSMTATVIDDETISCVFNNDGDGGLANAPAIIYYQDGAGALSNVINATRLAGHVVTVP